MGMFSITLNHIGRPKPYPVKLFYNVGLHVVATLTMSECIQLLTVCFKGMRYNYAVFILLHTMYYKCVFTLRWVILLFAMCGIDRNKNGAICGKI